jgi:predicted nicotinamide N-methyase
VSLWTVAHLEDYVDTAALLRDADAPEPPYWAHLWPGGRALARLIATEVDCAARRAIEIGCGLGLAGIVAARRGAAVVLMDSVADAARFARANAELNACGAVVLQADVRHAGLRGRFDYCLAADVTYDPALQVALAEFVAAHLAPDGRAWCAESVLTLDDGLRRACGAQGLHATERELRELDEGRKVPVRMTEVSWA